GVHPNLQRSPACRARVHITPASPVSTSGHGLTLTPYVVACEPAYEPPRRVRRLHPLGKMGWSHAGMSWGVSRADQGTLIVPSTLWDSRSRPPTLSSGFTRPVRTR